MLLIKNKKKREAALKNEAGGDEKNLFFFYLAQSLGCYAGGRVFNSGQTTTQGLKITE